MLRSCIETSLFLYMFVLTCIGNATFPYILYKPGLSDLILAWIYSCIVYFAVTGLTVLIGSVS